MDYQEKFEDERFVYELKVQSTDVRKHHLFTLSQGDGFFGQWNIFHKGEQQHHLVNVTDDECEIIVYSSVEAAVQGAHEFLNVKAKA